MRLVAYRYRDSANTDALSPPGGKARPPAQDEDPFKQQLTSALAAAGLPLEGGIQVYEDPAMAVNPSYRPQLAQLLADNQRTPADHLWVDGLADLGDSPAAVQQCLAALSQGGTTVWVGLDPPRLLDPTLAVADSLALATAMQDQQQRQQKKAGHARNRLHALPPPGKAPYGYRRGQGRYLIDRTAAPVITAFVGEFLLYGSLRGAVRFVEKRFGKRIAVSTGQRWLSHPVYRGDLQYRDGQVIRNTHAAIISRDEAAQIDRLLRRNRPLPPRTAGASRSLAGLVQCHTCGCAMTVSTTTIRGKTDRYLYLRPTACPQQPRCRALPYDAVLQAVIADICHTLPQAVAQWQTHRADPNAAPPPNPLAQLQTQRQQRDLALAQLPALIETGVLDDETATLRRYNLLGEIAQIEQQIAQLPPVNLAELASSVALPQFWLDLSEAERRFFFREFIRRIEIHRQDGTWRVILILVF
ncbi:MAG: recombinase family protein [Leptolyngbya sp.]|nr:recombinase family protein [Leptolyngbya sp.]